MSWKDVTVGFGAHLALRNVSASIPTGRIVGLVGPNGAGKSTLLRATAGLVRPNGGEISILGQVFEPQEKCHLRRVALMDQRRPLYENFKVRELLELGSRLNPRWDMTFAQQQIRRFGLDMHRRAGHLSGGQRTQVSATIAMAKRAEVLLLDEPLSDLDSVTRTEVLELIADEPGNGTTVLISSHNFPDLERVCDHYVVMRDGCVVLNNSLASLRREYATAVIEEPSALPQMRGQYVVIEERTDNDGTSLLVRKLAGDRDRFPDGWAQPSLEIILAAYSRGDLPSNSAGT